jgi:hypothetical protein
VHAVPDEPSIITTKRPNSADATGAPPTIAGARLRSPELAKPTAAANRAAMRFLPRRSAFFDRILPNSLV